MYSNPTNIQDFEDNFAALHAFNKKTSGEQPKPLKQNWIKSH